MKISRENYEIWFTDWLDNRLSEDQKKELDQFLSDNPDLRVEFNSLSELILNPSALNYQGKKKLLKKLSDIPESQYELLCAAALEGDLNPEQMSELSEITSSDPDKKRTAELIGLTKLNPQALKYQYKNKLVRRPLVRKLILYSAPVLSAAAMIAIILMTGLFNRPHVVIPESLEISALSPVYDVPAESLRSRPSTPGPTGQNSSHQRENTTISQQQDIATTLKEPAQISSNQPAVSPEKINLKINPSFFASGFHPELANGPSYVAAEYNSMDDERSRLGKFIARSLRTKVLDESTPSDSPLKGYEIAEAGITGLNKLLGWEMALTKNTDASGQTSSVNFNSRLLKFNAPVKNYEQGE